MKPTRRALLVSLAATGLSLTGCGAGALLLNPCRSRGDPGHRVDPALLGRIWEGLAPGRCWDMHVHLAGSGQRIADAKPWVNPEMAKASNPFLFAHYALFANASCVTEAPERADELYVERLANLVEEFPIGAKFLLYALDGWHDARGRWIPGRTVLRVPDEYARAVARSSPRRFEWAASIHPARDDALEALRAAKRAGARAVKWVPYFMNVDPALPRYDAFYAALAASGLPLIVHAGWQHELVSGADQELGNPLRLRRALERGVRVVVAHCATQGDLTDTETGAGRSVRPSFELFRRLVETRAYDGRLFGDISALVDTGRDPAIVRELLTHELWRGRLLNGSDYPLPGVRVAVSLDHLVNAGFVTAGDAPKIAHIQAHNPLLFDFAVKRVMRWAGQGFESDVFECAGFFAQT